MNCFYKEYFKRLLDIVWGIIGFVVCSIVFIIVGPIIYLTDKGPILYISDRLGKNGKIFKMFKFRSMKMNAPDIRNSDGTTFNSENDSRVTWIGKILRKTSLDELPQFINVLFGDMSLIGPRPDLPDAMNIYTDEEKRKLEVKPGITGYNQAYYRNSADLKLRFYNDVEYAENISFYLDIKIFFQTIKTILLKTNIYRN